RHHLRAEACDAAHGPPLVADQNAQWARVRGDAVKLAPGPVTRAVGRLRGAAPARIGAGLADEPIGRLVAEPLQEVAAEGEHGRAHRNIGIDLPRGRSRVRARTW